MKVPFAGQHRRLLFRSYLFLVAGLLAVAVILDFGFTRLQSSQMPQDEQWLTATFDLVEHKLAAAAPDTRQGLALSLRDQLGFGVQVLARDDVVENADREAPITTLTDVDGNITHLRDATSFDAIIRLGPIAEPRQSVLLRLLPPLFYLSIIVIVGLWLRPLLKDINRITAGAQRFAADYRQPLTTAKNVTELKGLASNLDAMSARLSGLIQSQKELIAALSHEMRTPLARIRFALAVIGNKSEADLATQLDALNDDVQEIDQLIASMLEYARLDHPDLRMHWQQVPMREWLAKLQTKCRTPDDEEPILQQNAIDSAWMDPKLMELALSNLLVNACRYTNQQIRITTTQTGTEYTMTVEDDGKGIPEAERQSVFKAFSRIDDSRNRDTGGYGLGLAIVARIAELHGGSVKVDASAELGGARFVMNWSAPPQ